MSYKLFVFDYSLGEGFQLCQYQTEEEAVAMAKFVIDRSLQRLMRKHCPETAEWLYRYWIGFGESASIESQSRTVSFSAQLYTEEKCRSFFSREEAWSATAGGDENRRSNHELATDNISR